MTSFIPNEAQKPSPPSNNSIGTSSALPQLEIPLPRGHLSSRTLAGFKSPTSGTPPMPRRRSSILSFSGLDDTRHSARDFIRPGLGLNGNDNVQDEEPSDWHSSPLAFAFLPALAGLFFTNGSAFVTDILLLGLAALFLNWSVRLPWDWYHSAQTVVALSQSRRSSVTLEDVSEVDEEEDDATGTVSGNKSSGSAMPEKPLVMETAEQQEEIADAAFRLKRHEMFALAMTFVMPAGAAYLLHVIRSQLSRPSEGLVSDYNLTIFLLAAEIRPIRQLIRLITNRTLHLQRIASGAREPNGSGGKREKALEDLIDRLAVLEAKTNTDKSISGMTPTSKEEMATLSSDMKRRYEPRLEALERAVRRYEKRATTLTLLTEQRLQSLESRLQDALSLAAVAAQSNNKPGLVFAVLSAMSRAMMLPLNALWLFLVWPLKATETFLEKASEFIYGRPKRRARRSESTQARSRSSKKREDTMYFGRHH